jgi:hypothetical protein
VSPRGQIFTGVDSKKRSRVKSHPRGKHGRLDETDVRTVNFTIGRPFRHLWPHDGVDSTPLYNT